MYAATHPHYSYCKQIKRGTLKTVPRLDTLSQWISERYAVSVVTILDEKITTTSTLVVYVYLDYLVDAMKFRKDDYWNNTMDEQKQEEIAKMYVSCVDKDEVKENIVVNCFALEPIAKEEAFKLVPEHRITNLCNQFIHPELLSYSIGFGTISLIIHVNSNPQTFKNYPIYLNWKSQLNQLVKEYDEFNYCKPNTFDFHVANKYIPSNQEINDYYGRNR